MRKYLYIISICCFILEISSQNTLKSLPKITVGDLKVEKSKLDSLASAEILFDAGETHFEVYDDRIQNMFQRTTRVKILSKEGYKYATLEIPFYVKGGSKEQILDFKATSYTLEDGRIVKHTVNKKGLFEEDINEWWKQKKYTFSNIKEGSIIEYKYEIVSPYNFNLRKWFFQHKIPVVDSKYKIRLCPYYNYIVLKQDFIKFEKDTTYLKKWDFDILSKSYDTQVYEWELKNVPPFLDEEHITCEDDYRAKIEFQLEEYYGIYGGKFDVIKTWDTLIDELLNDTGSFGEYLKSSKRTLKKILETIPLEGKSEDEKVKEISKYVAKSYSWNYYKGVYATQSKKDFINNKTGNDADINLFLISLLNAANIESYPMLISTRDHGKVYYQYPFLNRFNYVVALVNTKKGEYFIDATEPNLPIGSLPLRCFNGYGLQVKEVNVKEGEEALFYNLEPKNPDITKVNQLMKISKDGESIATTFREVLTGHQALKNRNNLQQDGAIKRFKKIISERANSDVENISIENKDNIDKPIIIEYELTNDIDNIGDKLFITPFFLFDYKKSKFVQQKRIYPVNYGFLNNRRINIAIYIPDGLEVEFVPENEEYNDEKLNLSYSFKTQIIGSSLQILMQANRGKSTFAPEAYNGLKKFHDKIIKKMSENIVLRKKLSNH